MIRNEKYIYIYTTVTSAIAVYIFLYGYISPLTPITLERATMKDLPIKIDNFSVNPEELYTSHVQKLVLVMIDSLKMDFLTDNAKKNLPYLSMLINEDDACLVPCNMPSPSISTQKIKSLTTGTTTSFMEAILTFGDTKLQMDNILRLAKESNLKISFCGADTWTQLFPDTFLRSETVNALQIFDYIETDTNVTKALLSELKNNDWDWLVLHYLGLKHLGYKHRSNSKAISLKLQKFDNIIEIIHKRFIAENANYMILLVGDTDIEKLNDPTTEHFLLNPKTLAPYVVIGKVCSYRGSSTTMSEFDMTPTLSVLTGIPIPASSYGSINSALLKSLTTDKRLYAFHYNAKRLIDYVSKLNYKYTKDPTYLLFQNAVMHHGMYLQDPNSSNNETLINSIQLMYSNVTTCISKEISNILNTSDIAIQYLALILLFEAMMILANRPDKITANKKLFIIIILAANLLITIWILTTGIYKRGTSLINMSQKKGIIITVVISIMICNSYIVAKQKCVVASILMAIVTGTLKSKETIETISSRIEPFKSARCYGTNSLFVILAAGTIFHAFSLLELSYIKCEKWLWFFLWASICFWIIYNLMQKIHRDPAISTGELEKTRSDYKSDISILISTLIMHRTIMAYSTVEHWLSHSNNQACASICLIFGLILLAFTCSMYYEPFTNNVDKTITYVQLGVVCCAIYMCNVARGNAIFFYYPQTSGTTELILFWIGWIFCLGYGLAISTIRTCYKGVSSVRQLMASGITCWALFTAMLTHSHKVMLIPIQMLYSQTLSDIFKDHSPSYILSHVWLGHLFFYYQGHTYNLDNVDRATALLVSQNSCILVFGILSVINIFSAPILSYLTCIYGMINLDKSASESVMIINKTFGCCRLLLISVYSLAMLVHRHNDWLWSILSPKLLYEVIYTFLLFTITIVMQGIVFVHDTTLPPTFVLETM